MRTHAIPAINHTSLPYPCHVIPLVLAIDLLPSLHYVLRPLD
jgi:hypothetical protein